MNIFRLAGDMSHLIAILLLLWKMWKSRSVAGISGKSQILFALVFSTRYLDLFLVFVSLYNSTMKVLYVAATYATLYLVYLKFRSTYQRSQDTFRIEFLILPAIALALLINHQFAVVEVSKTTLESVANTNDLFLQVFWTFSIYLEAVAIMPQLFMLSKTGEAETITTHYLFFLGLYRALYIFNWAYRYAVEDHIDLIAVIAGIVQTILYCDFFYLYVKKGIVNLLNLSLGYIFLFSVIYDRKKLVLPA